MNDKCVYASLFDSKEQAISAARALFSEIYCCIKNSGHTVDAFFEGEDTIPQITAIDGYNIFDKYTPLFNIKVESWYGKYLTIAKRTYIIVVEFKPRWHAKVLKSGKLIDVTRNRNRTPNKMDGQSMADFYLKYAKLHQEIDKKDDAKNKLDNQRIIETNFRKSLVSNINRERIGGRAIVNHNMIVNSSSDRGEEIVITLRCSVEEATALVTHLDKEFPLSKKTSGE